MSDEIKNENEAPKTEPSAELTEPTLDNVVGGVATGKHISSGKLHVRKAGGDPQEASAELSGQQLDGVVGGNAVSGPVSGLPTLHKYTNVTLKRG